MKSFLGRLGDGRCRNSSQASLKLAELDTCVSCRGAKRTESIATNVHRLSQYVENPASGHV